MDNKKAYSLIEKSNLSESEKTFLKKHFENLSEFADAMSNDNEKLINENRKSAEFESARQYLIDQYNKLSTDVEKLSESIKTAVCSNCGYTGEEKLRKLLHYIDEILKREENILQR